MPITFAITPRPDKREVQRRVVGATDYKQIYEKGLPYIHSIEIRNLDKTATLYISETVAPLADGYDEVGPRADVSEEWDPLKIYGKSSSGDITVLVIIKYYSKEYIARMAKYGIYEPPPEAASDEELARPQYGGQVKEK